MFSKRLAELRKKNKLSQKALAESIGFSQQAVAKWETDTATPSPEVVGKLSKLFNVSADYLLGNTDTPTPINNASSETSTEEALLIVFRKILGREPTDEDISKFLEITKVFFDVKD